MNRKNREGFRFCYNCKIEKPLTADNFCKEKHRPSGFAYLCRVCDNKRKDNRKERYKKLSEEDKLKHKAKNRRYTSEGYGRATALICAYRKMDRARGLSCDLNREFLVNEIFNKPCVYCGDTSLKLGCDRLDNRVGHTISNVVPCCVICNRTRMNNFTYDEMLILGKTIALVKQRRLDLSAK